MRVVSGPVGKEKTHFEAPEAARIIPEMTAFLDRFNNPSSPPVDPVLKAALAHLWFITIHPFDDGDGRIARAIADEETAPRSPSASSSTAPRTPPAPRFRKRRPSPDPDSPET